MQEKHAHYFLLLCLAASFVVVFLIIEPFLAALILAAVFAFLFQPIYKRLLWLFGRRESLAALITTLVAVVLVLLPVTILGTQIFKETSNVYQTLTSGGGDQVIGSIESTIGSVKAWLPLPDGVDLNLSQYAKQGFERLLSNLGAIFSSVAKILLSVFLFLIAFYFLLKDGRKLKNYLVDLSPLADSDDELVVSRLKGAVSATVKGNLTIGLIQGALTGIGFAIFGVPNAALWGSVAAVSALVPGIGTALVILPAIAYLFLTGNTFGGVGLIVWGVTAVGLIDNFLGPKLIGRGMRLHPLAVFLAVLGGLAFFGPLGFLLGPLAMSVCLALVDIYFSLKSRKSEGA